MFELGKSALKPTTHKRLSFSWNRWKWGEDTVNWGDQPSIYQQIFKVVSIKFSLLLTLHLFNPYLVFPFSFFWKSNITLNMLGDTNDQVLAFIKNYIYSQGMEFRYGKKFFGLRIRTCRFCTGLGFSGRTSNIFAHKGIRFVRKEYL